MSFTIEELLDVEAMRLCEPGQAATALHTGEFDIGGRVAVNAPGGLLSMGHPIGPTGVGQIAEITTQVRSEAHGRQHPTARTALAHMVGVGSASSTSSAKTDNLTGVSQRVCPRAGPVS